MKKRFKFLRLTKDNQIKSDSGNIIWKIGEWQKHNGKIELCKSGFHCSKKAYQAFSYVQGEILAVVECRGASDIQDDKEAYAEMRIIKAYRWTQNDSIDLAIYAAQMCLENFEKVYPDDKRPREAIEVAIAYRKCPCDIHKQAAWSAAWSARSARSARSAARSAWSAWSARSAARSAWSAWSAARSAWSAAESAAWSARSAAWSARSAAESAAWSAARSAESAAIKKITIYFDKQVKKLEEYV